MALVFAIAGAATVQAQDAPLLRARHAEVRDALANNPFARPIALESREHADGLRGDILARIDQPFGVVGAALQGVDRWCDILILHLNVKQCHGAAAQPAQVLHLVVGRKHDQPLDEAYRITFAYKVVASRPDYLQIQLNADEGPLGTSRYRIVLEAAALDGGRSIVALSYAYGVGMAARLAMHGYLATAGRDKVGFSVVGRHSDGQPKYIGGTRGVIERNTMRYYLAIESYLGALSLPPSQQAEKRLADWHSGVETYPRQLRELGRSEYLAIKRAQLRQQQRQAAVAEAALEPLAVGDLQAAAARLQVHGRIGAELHAQQAVAQVGHR